MATEMTTKPVKICSINLVNENGQLLDINIADFFLRFEDSFKRELISSSVILNGRTTSVFRFKHNDINKDKIFVIPLGHPKDGVVYERKPNDKLDFNEINKDLFNINLLYYNDDYNIALLTGFREAPNINKINEYFNSYIQNSNIRFRIMPLIKTVDIDTIVNSQEVKSVTLVLDLGHDANKYFNEGIIQSQSMIQVLKSLMDSANDINSNGIVLTFNVGERKRNSSMYKDKVCELLQQLDIENNDCIKQIQVSYRNGKSEKIEKAYLKNKDIILRDDIRCQRSVTGLDNELLNQAIDIIEKNNSDIYEYQQFRNNNMLETSERILLQNPSESEVINNGKEKFVQV